MVRPRELLPALALATGVDRVLIAPAAPVGPAAGAAAALPGLSLVAANADDK